MITRPGSYKPASHSMSYAEYPTTNPHSSELVRLIQEDLRRNGFALLRDMPFDTQDIEKTKAQFLSFCQQLGEPIPHNHSADSLVWSIRSMPYSESKFVTHSERNSEAELHTDSAFSENPEDFFCLFVVTKAECGGGESLLLSASNLLKEIRKSPDGRDSSICYGRKTIHFSSRQSFERTWKLKLNSTQVLSLLGTPSVTAAM